MCVVRDLCVEVAASASIGSFILGMRQLSSRKKKVMLEIRFCQLLCVIHSFMLRRHPASCDVIKES